MAFSLRKLDLSSLDYASLDSWFRRTLAGSTLVFGLLQHFFTRFELLNAIFIVLMAGNVGYFTNFMAIKMLFQPKQGRVLGWRGLVPQNKAQIAASLADSVQTQLLAPEILLEYIRERGLLGRGVDAASQWVDATLRDPDTRTAITRWVVMLLKRRGPDLLTEGFEISETRLKDLARRPDVLESLWRSTRERLLAWLEDIDNRRRVADYLQRVLLREMPELADNLNQALEEYLRRKRAMGSIGLGVKRIASFDRDAIQELLERFVHDPDASDQMVGMVDILLEQIRDYLDSDEARAVVHEKVEAWVAWAGENARESLLPELIRRLEAYLDDENNWTQIEHYCLRALQWARARGEAYIRSERGQALLKVQIERLVFRLNVAQLVEEQVMKLDTDELEKMILDNTGGNLVAIQILGGSLGMIAGLIQVHIGFAVPVFALIALVWLDAQRNRLRHAH